ncbi:PQQ-dependent sugar dehydrogenase [Candidatus Pelagibacter sp.]|nr:PQQ-dependent sugar dehydrogenase [Candidatus Pelagibacter sp.]
MKSLLYLLFILIFFSSKSFSENYKFSKIIELNEPWGSSFINNDEIIITEKNGKIKIINVVSKEVTEIKHNLNFLEVGQGGLLDIIYQGNILWISYSEDRGNSKTSTSIAKAKLDKQELDFKNIFQANPPIDSGYHFGSRLAIKGDYLYASVGERGQGMIAQDPTKHPGSIIRIHTDGSIPKDNPKFEGMKNWLPEIYQIGVRNPQGLTLSDYDRKIYLSNHGARGGDWFGEAKKGENYGWKILGWGGKNYSGTKIGPKWKPGFTKAIQYWVPSIATSAITIYKGNEFKEWNGHALVTSLKDKSLRKLIFNDLTNVKEDLIFKNNVGRIRDIQVHPSNGKIFFLSENALWLMEKKQS